MCKVWILEFGDFGFWGFWILDFGFWGFWILDFRDFGDFGFWIFGTLWQILCAKFWILDFGILDFGDLGFWILDWGFWMGTLWQNFGCYIRKEDCARRTGSADFHPENWGRFPFWRADFSDGWFNHQLEKILGVHHSLNQGTQDLPLHSVAGVDHALTSASMVRGS